MNETNDGKRRELAFIIRPEMVAKALRVVKSRPNLVVITWRKHTELIRKHIMHPWFAIAEIRMFRDGSSRSCYTEFWEWGDIPEKDRPDFWRRFGF